MRTWNLRYPSLAILLAISQADGASPELLTLVKTIPLKGVAGKLDHLAVDSKGERLYVANKTNNTLDVVDLATGKLIRQVPDQGKVSGVAYSADLNLIYVGNGAGTCNAFDRQDFKQVFSTPTPNADNIHYHSGNQTVYVGQDEILSELDAKTGEIKASIQLPGAVHGFKIDKKSGKIYTVLTKPNLVAVVDIAKREVTDKFELTLSDAGSPVAQDSENGLLFVGCPKKRPMIVVFDLKSGKEVAQVDIPAGVDDIHYDKRRHRLYASCGAGVLVAIEKSDDGYKVVARMEVPKDSRTCAWSSGRLYLGVPRQEGKEGPEVWVYESAPKE
ncbi:MAG: hypothetical protein JWP89_2088 [Schlesneria sp.]|nr:hypothetical protein [Schlesneria sp.]